MNTQDNTAAAVPVGDDDRRRRGRNRKRPDHWDPRVSIAGLFSEDRARALWNALPDEHRLESFDVENMPADYEAHFSERGGSSPNATWRTNSVDLRGLPAPVIWEVAWFIHQEVAAGAPVNTLQMRGLILSLHLVFAHGSADARAARSITALGRDEWVRQLQLAGLKAGKEAALVWHSRSTHALTKRIQDRLAYAYHDGEWWRLAVWNPGLDLRIPRRKHEPWGGSKANFSHLGTEWLRHGAQWWLSRRLLDGSYVWSSLKSRVDHFKWFQRYLDDVGCAGPHLVEDPRQLRPFIRRFVEMLRSHRIEHGPTTGQPLGTNQLRQPMITIETFYRWMVDNAEEAAQVLGEPGWLRLSHQHTALFRPEDKPRGANRVKPDQVLEDEVVSQIAAGSGLLAAPRHEGGLDSPQVFRALMLQLRTGRRMSEILMMDFEPLTPLLHLSEEARAAAEAGDGFVARMTYQQTKIESDVPASIPVDAEIVAIIRTQQEWTREFIGQTAPPGTALPYLFVRVRKNRHGQLPLPAATYNRHLQALSRLLAITDSMGRPVEISKTHRLRHTKATSLINAGVPLHVVMRYFGHVTPTMTMHYAQTLAQTAEQEFLRYKKVTADGRTVEIDPSDLFDVLALDQRADRVLPNGWCMLPPKQVCGKGNACLSCDKFVTDASHRDELQRQLGETEALIGQRQAQFSRRFGEPMNNANVWLAGRTAETVALRQVLVALDEVGVHDDGALRAVRAAGVPDGRAAGDGGETGGQPEERERGERST